MKLANRIRKYYARKSRKPMVVGVRHTLGMNGETDRLDETIKFLDGLVQEGDKVMLEISEYPLDASFRRNVNSKTRGYFEKVCQYLKQKGCEIIPAEDKEKSTFDDYYKGNIRNESFIEKILVDNPRIFIVGCGHLNYLRKRLPNHIFVPLVNYRREMRKDF